MYDIAFLMRGTLRGAVLKQTIEPQTATQIAKILGKHRSAVSRALLSLEEKGWVVCKNPNDPMWHYYQITTMGKKVLQEAKK